MIEALKLVVMLCSIHTGGDNLLMINRVGTIQKNCHRYYAQCLNDWPKKSKHTFRVDHISSCIIKRGKKI